MPPKDTLCRVSLDSYGITPISSWFEARKTEQGFDVVHWAEEFQPTPTIVSSRNEPYDWREFSKALMAVDEGFITDDAIPFVDVAGETGIRGECLRRAWAYHYLNDSVVDYLLEQSEDSMDQIDAILQSDPDSGDLVEFVDLLNEYSYERDFLTFLNAENLPLDSLISDLTDYLQQASDAAYEEAQQAIADKLAPFKQQIAGISSQYSVERRRMGAGITKPSDRDIVRRWLESYVLEHGSMPSGRHQVRVPFFGGFTGVGEIDFSAS